MHANVQELLNIEQKILYLSTDTGDVNNHQQVQIQAIMHPWAEYSQQGRWDWEIIAVRQAAEDVINDHNT